MKLSMFTLFLSICIMSTCFQRACAHDYAYDILSNVLAPSGEHCIFDADGQALEVVVAYDDNNLPVYRAYPFGNITISGSYKLATRVTSRVSILTNNVTLDLNGNTIAGGISIAAGLRNITIKNGIIDAAANTTGIVSASGCSKIRILNVTVRNAQAQGISCTQTIDSIVKNCEMVRNGTGLELRECSNIIIENCIASRNTQTGFGMLLSTTCSFLACHALSTGDGNTNVLSNNVSGFLSSNGSANIFENCIANATQALSTTDYNSIVAGFALTGTERCTQISGCQATGAQTNARGVTVPYGIYLQPQFDGLISVTSVNPGSGSIADTVYALDWSSDGIYLAAGGDFEGTVSNDLIIYQFDRLSQGLTQVVSANIGNDTNASVRSVAWSPNGEYLAVGAEPYVTNLNDLLLYRFNRVSQTLQLVEMFYLGDYYSHSVRTVAWSPDGMYLAVGGSDLTSSFIVYRFDSVAQTLTQIFTLSFADPTRVNTLDWTPDGQYIALGKSSSDGNDLLIYAFNRSTQQFTQIISLNLGEGTDTDLISSVAWSPDGRYLAIGGDIEGAGFNDEDLWIYEFDRNNQSLVFVTAIFEDGTLQSDIRSISWSSDGRYLAVASGVNVDAVIVYYFDRGIQQLKRVGRQDAQTNFRAVSWSPDGQYIASGGTITGSPGFDLILYRALSFPSHNVIQNNTVSCNSGARFPSGVGISGTSICNMIIQNTAYANPVNPSSVSTNYQFICNVFNPLFNNAPSQIQNLVLDYVQPIALPTSLGLLSQQAQSLTSYIQSKVEFLYRSKFG